MTKTNNTPANVNNVKNTPAALNNANGKTYKVKDAPTTDAAADGLATATTAAETAKEAFVAAASTLRTARETLTAAALDNCRARYAAGVATAEDLLTIANALASDHAAAAVASAFEDMAEVLKEKSVKKALRAAVADSVSLGQCCKHVRERFTLWGEYFNAAGVAIEKAEVTPAAMRPHSCNPFAVAVTKDGLFAALPAKGGALRPVTAWTPEKVAMWLTWHALCAEQMTTEQCEQRRTLLDQVAAQFAAVATARAEEKAARKAAKEAEKKAEELTEAVKAGEQPAAMLEDAERLTEEATKQRKQAKAANRTKRAAMKGEKAAKATAKAANAAPAEVQTPVKPRRRTAKGASKAA
ncbi:MAG: hypothetical protein IJ767_03940 [Bacteroidaceae bacterium]|nr:hypothetical protein [Bacteroidaceae bacterium]